MTMQTVVEFVIAVVAMAVSVFLIPWLKQKIGEAKMSELLALVQVAVEAAEQLFGAGTGDQKKQYVVKLLQNQGIDATSEKVNAMIESAVLGLNVE